MENQHAESSLCWEIPSWVSSRSYALGTPSARSILTNARWWTNIVLAEASADFWAALPQRFSLADLADRLRLLGIDLEDGEAKREISNFLGTLHTEGCVRLMQGDNPCPAPCADQGKNSGTATGNVTSVEADFNDWLSDQGLLSSAFIELTYRCNQRCVHCFNPGAAHRLDKRVAQGTNEITTQEVVGLLADLADLGVYTVTFSGGEISLRGDLLEILQETKRFGLSFNLFTNGQFSEHLLERICSLWPRTLGVSIYSADSRTHDATTGVAGSFARSVETLRRVSAAGVRATVKCPLMRHTVAGYKRVLELCDEVNALPQFDLHISAGMDGNRSCTVHQITDTETLALIMRDPRIAMYVGLDIPNAGRGNKPLDGQACGAGTHSLSIAPDGAVYPCNSLPLPIGNLHSARIQEIWKNSSVLQNWNSVVLSDFDECGLYARCSYCNLCPGMAMAEGDHVFVAPRTCCRTAEVRMKVSQGVQAGHDPLEERALEGKPLFGYDITTCLPCVDQFVGPVGGHNGVCGDPRKKPVTDFVRLVEHIHAEGNKKRREMKPEDGSPEAANVRRSGLNKKGFTEFGR